MAEIVPDRPGKLNTLGLDDVTALREAFDRATAEHARAVLLRTEGRAFCVGRDLTGLSDDEDVTETLRVYFNRLIRTIQACGIPTVAATRGPASGRVPGWRSHATWWSPRSRPRSPRRSAGSARSRTRVSTGP